MFYLMRKWLSRKQKRAILFSAIPAGIFGAVFFWAITLSRFGSQVGYFMYKYLGEAINNFNGLLFNRIESHTYGRAYFSLFYRYLLGQTDFVYGDEKWSFILNTTGIRGDIFYTWVGGLVIEFGKVIPVIVAIILNRVLTRMMVIEKYYYGDAIVLIFFVNFFSRGIFLFPTQNFEGNMMILYTFLLYFIFRIQRTRNERIVLRIPRVRWKKRI